MDADGNEPGVEIAACRGPLRDQFATLDDVIEVAAHAQVVAILNDHRFTGKLATRTYKRLRGIGPRARAVLAETMREGLVNSPTLFMADPPALNRYRSACATQLGATHVQARTSDYLQSARTHVEALAAGEINVLADIAYPLISGWLGDLLGYSSAHSAEQLAEWIHALGVLSAGLFARDPTPQETYESAMRSRLQFLKATRDVVQRAHQRPDGSLLSDLASETHGFTLGELLDMAQQLLLGGAASALGITASAVRVGLTNAALREQLLGADADVVIDELARLESVAGVTFRRATAECTVGGVDVKADDMVILRLDVADRDESVFDCPHSIDATGASAPRSLAYGFGRHSCIGARQGRLMVHAITTAVLESDWSVVRAQVEPAAFPRLGTLIIRRSGHDGATSAS
jgi:cytochrome P450